MPRRVGDKKPSFGGLTYVMPSRCHQRSPPRQRRTTTIEPSWLEVEPERGNPSQRSFLVVPPVPMQRQRFVDPRSSETKEVLSPAGRRGVIGVPVSSWPNGSRGFPPQRVLSSSQDFHAGIDSSSSYWESQFSSEDAAAVRRTGASHGNLTYKYVKLCIIVLHSTNLGAL
ncbi:hypothetical protein MRX96_059923 [Rhipicephalus microplus]